MGQVPEDRRTPGLGSDAKHWGQGVGAPLHFRSISCLIIQKDPPRLCPEDRHSRVRSSKAWEGCLKNSFNTAVLTSEMSDKEMR